MDKQIEKLAKELDYCETHDCIGESCAKCRAIWLIENGYRKIPEGSVVLTEEQFSEFRQAIINLSQEHTKKCDEVNDKIIKARKQAVKEFAERLKKERQLIDLGCGDGCYEYIDIDDIDYIAIDEFGVEL